MILGYAVMDEVEKIAMASPGTGVLGRAAQHLKDYTTKGWDAQGGKLWKGIGVGLTALQVPGVMARQDPAGLQRSRLERGLDLAGSTVGGFAGAGFAARHLPSKGVAGFLAPMVAGTAGSVLGSKFLAGPLATMRKARLARQSRDQMVPDESWRAQSPVQSPPATEGRELL